MTPEEIESLKAEAKAEAAKEYEEEKNKLLSDKQQLNAALREERERSKAMKAEPKPETQNFDVEAFRKSAVDEAKKAATEITLTSAIVSLLDSVSSNPEERKVIEARFNALRGAETDPAKLRELALDAKLLANRDRLMEKNPVFRAVGSVGGGRDSMDTNDDDSGAKKLGRGLFGLTEDDFKGASPVFDIRNQK
jgi:hypothetical protein